MGPCLCGDPYCPSCGNPGQAAFADLVAEVGEMIQDQNPTTVDEAIDAVLTLLSQDAAMCTALEDWQQRMAKERKR